MGAALDHGRRAGGPALRELTLRELTFHQRAALRKALAGHLREHRQELYALSARAGSTRRDATFDIDGGIAVLNAYSGIGRRELPNDVVYVNGAVQPLSKGGTFAGQHIGTSRPGVAVRPAFGV
jgi:oxepin-CoA hydrolase/3-oxo-5,6-dehydrosuberyl-CoA semialdehyde dehydrogenase